MCLFFVTLVRAQGILVLDPGNQLATLAGRGDDGHTATARAKDAALGWPRGLAYDREGNLYIADSRNHQVDRVSPTGAFAVVAGNGRQGYGGDGGPATAAELDSPTAVALASDGSVYIADSGNHCIRHIANGTITKVSMCGVPGFGGDGGSATAAVFRSPGGLAFATDGSLYVADTGNHRLRKISPGGTISTIAGTDEEGDEGDGGAALTATFRSPGALQILPDGRLLIADRGSHRIRALSSDGTISAYETGATLRRPEGLAADSTGNLLIADAANQQTLLSGLDASGVTASNSVAGSGAQGTPTAGAATDTAMDSPAAAALDPDGNVAISDRRNHQVQRVTLSSLAFGDIPAGRSSASQTLSLTNGSQKSLVISAVLVPSGFGSGGGSPACPATPFTLQPAATCGIDVFFSPVAQGAHKSFLRVQLANQPSATVILTGNSTAPGSLVATSTALSSDGSISFAGTPVRFSVTVSGALGTPPAGNVAFWDGDTPLSTIALSEGSATFATAAMQTGRHLMHAVYGGDAEYAGSASADLTQTVVPAPDFSISAASSNYSGSAGGGISIPITILPLNGTLNHTVRLDISGLPAGATALFTPSVFSLGGDPTTVSLAINMPVTLAHDVSPAVPLRMAGCLGGLFFLAWRSRLRRRRTRVPGSRALLSLGMAALLCSGGCAGGFRAASTNSGTATTAKTFHYTATVTGITTDVMGAALVHTATINLAVSQ